MAINYPYYMGYPQQQVGIKGRPVSSLDEVRATSIDFDGSIFYFPDVANKKIYTKQINLDGTSMINIYELKPTPEPVHEDFVTRAEFEAAIKELQKQKETTKPSPIF